MSGDLHSQKTGGYVMYTNTKHRLPWIFPSSEIVHNFFFFKFNDENAAVASRKLHCLVSSGLGFDPLQVGHFKFLPGTGIRRDGRGEPQPLVYIPNIRGLNPKSPLQYML